MFVCCFSCMCTSLQCPWKPEEGGVGFPGTGAQTAVSHLMWILGTKPRTSEREGHVLNQEAISPVLCLSLNLEIINSARLASHWAICTSCLCLHQCCEFTSAADLCVSWRHWCVVVTYYLWLPESLHALFYDSPQFLEGGDVPWRAEAQITHFSWSSATASRSASGSVASTIRAFSFSASLRDSS